MNEKLSNIKDYLRKRAFKTFLKYNMPRWMVFSVDIAVAFLIFLLAYIVRFNFALAEIDFDKALFQGLIATTIFCIFSLILKSYAGILRHTTLTDITLLFIVTTLSLVILTTLSLTSSFFGWHEIFVIPLSIILIHYVSITVALFFMRIAIKILFRFATKSGKEKQNVLIYGAGDMGFVVKRVLLSDPNSGFDVIGFIDDNKKLEGRKINGLTVYSPLVLNTDFVYRHKIDTLIIAIQNISADKKSEIIRTAIDVGLDILETPAVDKWLHGQLDIKQLRKVKLEDLLGRDPIKLNMDLIGMGLKDKTILVTGAAGSIGSEIVRQLSRFNVSKVILVDIAETPLFHLGNELKTNNATFPYCILMADVTNHQRMEGIFREYKPDIVFHAAAYKHVPMMEENPHEAVRVNVGGTRLITDLSIKYDVERFVMISTDKSVNPTSVMGATKRICEMVVQLKALTSPNTNFVITRFGNVLGSNGSVIPIFEKQIKEGGPVTVTHPEITRYFMTIPEACELVLEAGFMGNANEIYVFDMGDPVPIVDLAYQMIKLSGLVPEKDIEVIFTGLRPGEKMFEELLSDKENTLPTHHPKIKIARVEEIQNQQLLGKIDNILKVVYDLSGKELIDSLVELVPDYKTNNGNHSKDRKREEQTH